jgi:hypothetical protein
MASIPFHSLGLTLAAMAAGAATGHLPSAGSATLDPIAFFTGRSEGEGSVDTLLGKPVKLLVESVGHKQGDTLILDQTIREGAKPARNRRWIMRPVAPGRYTGTLTDAEGPVNVTVAGPQASIRYRMRGGFDVNQQLTLQGDGRMLLNRLHVKKFGVRVAIVEETIRKMD